MSNATETAIRSIIIFPADWEVDQRGVAYGEVEYKGQRFNLQYSRPRHPSNMGQLMDSGVDVLIDDGHDDNANFATALGDDVDFATVVEHVAFASRAEVAIQASEVA